MQWLHRLHRLFSEKSLATPIHSPKTNFDASNPRHVIFLALYALLTSHPAPSLRSPHHHAILTSSSRQLRGSEEWCRLDCLDGETVCRDVGKRMGGEEAGSRKNTEAGLERDRQAPEWRVVRGGGSAGLEEGSGA